MLRRLALAAIACLLMAAAPPPVTDLTGAWTALYAAAKDKPPAEQVARFKAELAPLFPGFYNGARNGIAPADYDAIIVRTFARFPAIAPAFAARASAVSGQLADAYQDFARAFPDLGAMPQIYLVHSLGEMDGGTREIGGKTVLVFGADLIAKVHAADANERPFFEHELFHVYHEPRFRACDAIWCALWEEGLATYVAARLNPDAKAAELLLDAKTLAEIRANPAPLACLVRAVALSTDDKDYKRLFNGGASFPGQPERGGYYLGMLVAERIGKRQSLRALASMPEPRARAKVLGELDAMANDCPRAALN
jgi:hypothetical protein